MGIFIWKQSFNCISLIFKSERWTAAMQNIPAAFEFFCAAGSVCKTFVREWKTEQNRTHNIPDPVFCLLQYKTFPHPEFVQPPADSSARPVRSHPILSCWSLSGSQANSKVQTPAPLLAAERKTQEQKGSLGHFFTHSNEQYLVYCPKKPAGIRSPFPASQGEGCWSVCARTATL